MPSCSSPPCIAAVLHVWLVASRGIDFLPSSPSPSQNTELASGIFFFFTMELLQFIQYFYIAADLNSPLCDDIVNKTLTLLGFLHICMQVRIIICHTTILLCWKTIPVTSLQPYFCHVINASLTKSPKYLDRYVVIKRLCVIGGG